MQWRPKIDKQSKTKQDFELWLGIAECCWCVCVLSFHSGAPLSGMMLDLKSYGAPPCFNKFFDLIERLVNAHITIQRFGAFLDWNCNSMLREPLISLSFRKRKSSSTNWFTFQRHAIARRHTFPWSLIFVAFIPLNLTFLQHNFVFCIGVARNVFVFEPTP